MATLDMDTILIEILPKLPAKTLIRFKSVCKSFNTTISSREFAVLHLRHHSLSSQPHLILAGNRRVNCYNLESHSPSTVTTAASTFSFGRHSSISVVGSVNGLLCILRHQNSINYLSILNLTTRACRRIDTLIYGGKYRVLNFGFGFDHVNLDHRIVFVSDYRDEFAVKTRETRVYSLNKSAWNVIDTVIATDTMEERHGGVLIDDNLLHWMFWVPSSRKRRIGCFDICKGNWVSDVLLPKYYYDPTHKNFLLDFGLVNNCLFSTFENRIEDRYDVWVMEEYGVQESWVVLLSIPVRSDFEGGVVPVACCRSSNKVLIRQRHSCRLSWYNKVDDGVTEAVFDGAPDFSNLQVYMCCRSLVDIPGGVLFSCKTESCTCHF